MIRMHPRWLAVLVVALAAVSLAGCRTPFTTGSDRVTRCLIKEREKFGSKYTDVQYNKVCQNWDNLKQLDDEGNYHAPGK